MSWQTYLSDFQPIRKMNESRRVSSESRSIGLSTYLRKSNDVLIAAIAKAVRCDTRHRRHCRALPLILASINALTLLGIKYNISITHPYLYRRQEQENKGKFCTPVRQLRIIWLCRK